MPGAEVVEMKGTDSACKCRGVLEKGRSQENRNSKAVMEMPAGCS